MHTYRDLKLEVFKKSSSLLLKLFRNLENYRALTEKNKTEFDLYFMSSELVQLKWSKHYLTNRHYRLFKLLHFFPKTHFPDKHIPDRIYKFAINLMDKQVLKITLNTDDKKIESISIFEKFILSRGLAFYFDALSTIQNGRIIGDLLNDFLKTSNIKSLTDAMKVDPSVEHIPKINKHINSLSISNHIDFRTKSANAIKVPILTPHKNRVHIEVPMFFHYAAISGLLKGPYRLEVEELFNIAKELNVIPLKSDISKDFFRKQLKYYRTL